MPWRLNQSQSKSQKESESDGTFLTAVPGQSDDVCPDETKQSDPSQLLLKQLNISMNYEYDDDSMSYMTYMMALKSLRQEINKPDYSDNSLILNNFSRYVVAEPASESGVRRVKVCDGDGDGHDQTAAPRVLETSENKETVRKIEDDVPDVLEHSTDVLEHSTEPESYIDELAKAVSSLRRRVELLQLGTDATRLAEISPSEALPQLMQAEEKFDKLLQHKQQM